MIAKATIKIVLKRLTALSAIGLSAGCSMSEEVKRIEQVNQLEQRRKDASSTDLTGQQIFMRSCNTCHPGGRPGMGPALDKIGEHFPNDQQLKSFIRKGKGSMPAQPPEILNDKELDNLIDYLRALKH
jgi:mono/diheme cytochrome c family protein